MSMFDNIMASGKDLEKYLPQRWPMIMVSGLHALDENRIYTSLDIAPDNIFCNEGYFTEAGIIEHIAQSIGIRNGYLDIKYGRGVRSGVIGNISATRIISLPKAGSRLETVTTVEGEYFGLVLVKAIVSCGDIVVAECKMKVALKEKEE